MTTWQCQECGLHFLSEHSTACLQCGSIDTISLKEKTEPEPAGRCTEPDKRDTEEIKSILLNLCKETYECSYQSHEWKAAIEKAIERLKPYLKEFAVCHEGH